MIVNEVFGLGAHADTPVTPEEDEAFAALEKPPVAAPVGPVPFQTIEQLNQWVACHGSVSKSPPSPRF